MGYTDFYYNVYIGETPDNDDYYNKTKSFFEYLKEATTKENIQRAFNNGIFKSKEYLSFEDVPNELYENSLLKKDTFYYHKTLQLVSKPPVWLINENKCEAAPFYLEMKISYSCEDIYSYMLKNMRNIREEWMDEKSSLGAIKFLLDYYKKFDFMEPVDFLLHLIDYCSSRFETFSNVLDMRKYEIELATELEGVVKNYTANKKNKIVHRR